MTSYVIKNGHIDHKKDTYETFQHTLATPINNDLEYLMRKDYFLYLKWKVDGKLELRYEEKIMTHCLIMFLMYLFVKNFDYWIFIYFCNSCWKKKYVWKVVSLV